MFYRPCHISRELLFPSYSPLWLFKFLFSGQLEQHCIELCHLTWRQRCGPWGVCGPGWPSRVSGLVKPECTLLHGSEAWSTYTSQENRLNSFHLRCLHWILGITWQECSTQESWSRLIPPACSTWSRQTVTLRTWRGSQVNKYVKQVCTFLCGYPKRKIL